MEISIIDGSKYFKGLLILIRQDRKVTDSEIDLMKRIGKSLGFEKTFCENAIHEILDNKHIKDDVPVFSNIEIAKRFIKDGLSIANSDVDVHEAEETWLRSAAESNGIDSKWFKDEREKAEDRHRMPRHLEVEKLTIVHKHA